MVRWLLCGMVCAALALIFARSLQPDDSLARGVHAPHRYAAAEPSWAQLALPRLGTPLAPPTSVTAIVTHAIGGPSMPAASGHRLASVALALQLVALVFFFLLARQMRIDAAVAAVAMLTLGLEPAFFEAATSWTPYATLPAILFAALLSRAGYIDTSDPRWLAALAILIGAAVSESVYALVLMIPLLVGLGLSRMRRHAPSRWRWLLAALAGACVIGLALQVFGAAAAWRSVSTVDPSEVPPWRDAVVAATSRWGRLLESYVLNPLPDTAHRLRDDIASVGLFAPMLAAFGVFALLRSNRRSALFFIGLSLAVLVVDAVFAAPVGSLSAAHALLPAVVYLLAARGISALLEHVAHPAVALACCGAVLAGDGLATRRISAIDRATADAAARARTPPVALPRASALVASDAEADRLWDYAAHINGAEPSASRIPQNYGAIRQAFERQSPVFLRLNDVQRVATMGWLIASFGNKTPLHDAQLAEIVEPTSCVQLEGDASVDLASAARAGAVGLQAERGSRYQIDFEAEGLSAGPSAKDAITNSALPMRRRDSTHLALAVPKGRELLPVVDFESPPGRIRAQLVSDDRSQRVRICGAPVRGDAIRLDGNTAVALPIASRTIFASGWHPAEPTAGGVTQRWSRGTTASAVVQLPGEPAQIEVTVEALAAAPADHRPTLTLNINGVALAPQPMLPGARSYAWTVSPNLLRRGLNVFRLDVPEAFSPRALGLSEDERLLGFALSGFRLRRGAG